MLTSPPKRTGVDAELAAAAPSRTTHDAPEADARCAPLRKGDFDSRQF
jgi:hypothetical protein